MNRIERGSMNEQKLNRKNHKCRDLNNLLLLEELHHYTSSNAKKLIK